MTRTLIVNADDFGQSPGITRGIIDAYERGIVTSASLMVRWAASAAAAAYARTHPFLGVGLHIDLGEWRYRDGSWQPIYTRVDLGDPDSVHREIRQQLDRCRDLIGGNPTHLDSHQHVHRSEPVRSILRNIAAEVDVPLRDFSPGIRHYGGFYGQSQTGQPLHDLITTEYLVPWLTRLAGGVTELSCHPGYADDLDTMYGVERTTEIETLCSPEVRQVLVDENIRLSSFAEVESA